MLCKASKISLLNEAENYGAQVDYSNPIAETKRNEKRREEKRREEKMTSTTTTTTATAAVHLERAEDVSGRIIRLTALLSRTFHAEKVRDRERETKCVVVIFVSCEAVVYARMKSFWSAYVPRS